MGNERAWPQQCWKSCANGSNIVALRFGDHGIKEMFRVVGWKFWPVSNFAHQHATTSENIQQDVQTDATCNIQQCWELLRACWQWCANGCNNSQQCWDLRCIVGRIQPISLCKPCVMSVRGPNNVGRAVQTDLTLLRYASAITERKKCWELLRP